MTILLLSPVGDLHCEKVGDILRKRGVAFLSCDLAQFPIAFQLSTVFDAIGRQESWLQVDGHAYRLDQVSAVWDRSSVTSKIIRPVRLGLEAYIRAETQTFLKGLYYLAPQALWVSNPLNVDRAEIKIHQKQVATRLGFTIPSSCIGNMPDSAKTLIARHETMALKSMYRQFIDFELTLWQRLCKLIYDFRHRKVMEKYRYTNSQVWESLQYRARRMIYTQAFQREDAQPYLAALPACPVILQQYIPKKLELRITVVGDKIFPCAIYSQSAQDHGKIDWRGHEDEAHHEPYTLPREIEQRCFTLVRELGLQFGSIDMIVTPKNEYVFLEINCHGQWLWVQEKTGMPIAEAVADLLMTPLSVRKDCEAIQR